MPPSPLSILLVDDEENIRLLGKRFLEQTDELSVITADSGKNALLLLGSGEHSFDAVVADYHMQETDGISLLREIRSLHGSIPFIIFTSGAEKEAVIEAINAGADYYLQKGESLKTQWVDLAAHIRTVIHKRRNTLFVLPPGNKVSSGELNTLTFFFSISPERSGILTGTYLSHPRQADRLSMEAKQFRTGEMMTTLLPSLSATIPPDLVERVAAGESGSLAFSIKREHGIIGAWNVQVFHTGYGSFAVQYTPEDEYGRAASLLQTPAPGAACDVTTEMAATPVSVRIQPIVLEGLCRITGAAGGLFSEYDPTRQTLSVTDVSLPPGLNERITRILGKKPQEFCSYISEKESQELVRRILQRKDSLLDISNNAISPIACAAIQQLIGIDHFIRIAHVVQGNLLGTSVIAIKPYQDIPPDDLLRMIANTGALSLQRQQDDIITRKNADLHQ